MPIINAKDKKVGDIAYNLPDVSAAVMRFFQNLAVQVMNTTLVDGRAQNVPVTTKTQGCIQPMPELLAVKMEGDRSWVWWIIDCLPDLVLETNDRIVVNDKPYRVMRRGDARSYEYVEYYIIEDYVQRSS